MPASYLFLMIAILAEVAGTTALQKSDGFTRLYPSLFVVIGYGIAFFCLSLALRTIPVGIAYAIWSGIGVALIALIAWLFLDQKLDLPAIVGILLIVTGVIIMNLFSKTVVHQ